MIWKLLGKVKWRARYRPRIGPYERRYSAKLTERGLEGRFTGDGLRFGRLRVNLTAGTWTYDTPGRGGIGPHPLPAWLRRLTDRGPR